jgi:predicted ATPase
VGREDDIRGLVSLIRNHRLVTVAGCSGVGKTRVALEAAARHACNSSDEVWLVDLAALDESASIPHKIASVAGEAALSSRKMLLLFENGAHLIPQIATTASTILESYPGVNILVTNAEPLGVAEEATVGLLPLALPHRVPSNVEEARRYSALELFIRRAESEANYVPRAENLQKIAEICLRLKGIPRAIELAAAHLPALGLRDLHSHLEELRLGGV